MMTDVCTLAGGCFWCLDAAFRDVRGVVSVTSGYAGGNVANPTYRQVCTGMTGHAEVVQVEFDETLVSFRQLLQFFFSLHDPTTLNRQGADVGTQYRSAVFYHSPEQKQIAEDVIAELKHTDIWEDAIVTTLEPMDAFYPAEDYHQDYYRKDPESRYCQFVVSPKIAKFRKEFRALLK